jgi:hypothetical protein
MRNRLVGFFLFVLALIVWAVLPRTEIGRVVLARMWPPPPPEVDRGTYFRFRASYLYKGQPLDFDIVAGCNAKIPAWPDATKSFEAGLVPYVYGLKMPDGQGVVVRVPAICQGETTENGRVPKDLLPFVAVYQSADEPKFGWLYATDDAYASPLSELKLNGASIHGATRGEFDTWRVAEAGKNIVKPWMLTHGIGGFSSPEILPRPGVWYFGADCLAYSRKPIPEELKGKLSAMWPDDRPHFWSPPTNIPADLAEARWKMLDDLALTKIGPHRWTQVGMQDQGAARWRHGGGIPPTYNRDLVASPEIYPTKKYNSFNNISELADKKEIILSWRQELNVNGRLMLNIPVVAFPDTNGIPPMWHTFITPERKGFAYCDAPGDLGYHLLLNNNRSQPHLINGERVVGWNGFSANASIDDGYERNSYALKLVFIELKEIGGGL